MLYPKIEKKKKKVKSLIVEKINNIKNAIFNCISVLKSGKQFILFVEKSFHF